MDPRKISQFSSVTAEILLTLSLCVCMWGGGQTGGVMFLANPTFVRLGSVELMLSWGCDKRYENVPFKICTMVIVIYMGDYISYKLVCLVTVGSF